LRGVSGVRVVTSGLGQEAAARTAAAELARPVGAVVVCGFAGGCDPALVPGTLVVATALCDGDGTPLDMTPLAAAVRDAVLSAASPSVAGPVASTSGVVDHPAARARLAAAGVLAVETEAAAWAEACRRAGVPLVVVRAVLDTPERTLGELAGLIAPGGVGPSTWGLLRLVPRRGTLTALERAARGGRVASRHAAAGAAAAAAALRPPG
jgi:adenosylhomocysteine nucleosidase